MGLFESKSHAARIAALEDAVRRQSGDHETLKDQFERLKAQHESLRGYTYALRAKHVGGLKPEPEGDQQPLSESKEELRRRLGIKPWERKS